MNISVLCPNHVISSVILARDGYKHGVLCDHIFVKSLIGSKPFNVSGSGDWSIYDFSVMIISGRARDHYVIKRCIACNCVQVSLIINTRLSPRSFSFGARLCAYSVKRCALLVHEAYAVLRLLFIFCNNCFQSLHDHQLCTRMRSWLGLSRRVPYSCRAYYIVQFTVRYSCLKRNSNNSLRQCCTPANKRDVLYDWS